MSKVCVIIHSMYDKVFWTGIVAQPYTGSLYSAQTCKELVSTSFLKLVTFATNYNPNYMGCVALNGSLEAAHLFEVRNCEESHPYVCERNEDRRFKHYRNKRCF